MFLSENKAMQEGNWWSMENGNTGYLIVTDKLDTIFCGEDEMEAHRRFRTIQGKKNLYKAVIDWVDLEGTLFINDYKILEVIK